VDVNITAGEAVVDVDGVRVTLEKILSGLERGTSMKRMPQDESVGAADDPSGFQFAGDVAGGVSGAEEDELLGAGGSWEV
jgi:hypothetical protein